MAKDGVVTKAYGLRLKFRVDETSVLPASQAGAVAALFFILICSLILALL